MKNVNKFSVFSLVFLIPIILLYMVRASIKMIDGGYKNTLPGNEIYNAIDKSREKTNFKKLVIGDSTANQFFNNKKKDDLFYSLACNQAIGMCGHFFLLDDYLKSGNRPEEVYLILNAYTLSNNLNQIYTYHYFLKPFFTKDYKNRMTGNVLKEISKIPYYLFCQFPPILTSTWAPEYKVKKDYSFMSPISNEYLWKIDSLRKEFNFHLYLIPSLLPQSKTGDINHLFNDNIDEVSVRFRKTIMNYIENITYIDDTCFIDGTHLRYPQLYKSIIEEKMENKSLIIDGNE